MKTKTFPERVERLGSSATIYAPKDESKGFTVAYHVRGKLVRKVRNSYEDAKKLALSVVEQKANGELDILTLSNKDCYVYLRALESRTLYCDPNRDKRASRRKPRQCLYLRLPVPTLLLVNAWNSL